MAAVNMERTLLIAGTGNTGRHVLSALVAEGAPVRVLSRTPNAFHLPASVELVDGDLREPETLSGCLENVNAVYLVWTAPPETVEPVIQKLSRSVQRIVFLSAPLKTPHPFFQQLNPGRDMAERIERAIESSGMEWTLLRPGLFAGNAKHFWGPQIRRGDRVRWPYLNAATAPIDERDHRESFATA